MSAVTLPRWMLVALAAALVVSLLALAFLLGRASAVPGGQVLPGQSTRFHVGAAPPPQAASSGAPEPTPAVASTIPAFSGEPVGPLVVESSPVTEPTPGVERSPEATAAGRVAAYFARIGRIQGAGGLTGGAAGAQQILTATLQGDSSELDRLVAEAERTRRELGTVQPPAECAAYHATLLRLMGDSGALLGDLRAALLGEDSSRLATLASKAMALQTSVEELKAMEQELRRRYGLSES